MSGIHMSWFVIRRRYGHPSSASPPREKLEKHFCEHHHHFFAAKMAENKKKIFLCNICNQRMKTQLTLDIHSFKYHNPEHVKKYQCKNWLKIFINDEKLKIHHQANEKCEKNKFKMECKFCKWRILGKIRYAAMYF